MSHDHIVTSFDNELERIRQNIMRMGGEVESQFAKAIQGLVRRDSDLARKVMEQDANVDALETELEEATVKLMALRQPMADDLRAAVAGLKISSDLERIGDLAKNIAKRSIALNQMPPCGGIGGIQRMARMVQGNTKDMLDAYANLDIEMATAVWERDAEVDEMYTALFRELLTYMMEDPRNISPCTHMVFIAKNIERMGDHATNIAETVIYLGTGKRVEAERPKSDTSSFQVLTPDGQEETEQ
ncbi:MAG TPA: phosphate signaling complex protein PhoU [Kiloniellaceae bacterium]|nr:phosphate signaling complex protein PhoU [Kiloniellaceae bacterium]